MLGLQIGGIKSDGFEGTIVGEVSLDAVLFSRVEADGLG